MKIFITQPTYLPWLGIFKAIDYCDLFVFYDDVQYERKSWQNRNRIINRSTGAPLDLIVPVKKVPQKTLIYEIKIANPLFYEDQLKKIRVNYPQNDFREEVMSILANVYEKEYHYLSQLTTELTKVLAKYIGVEANFSYSKDSPKIVGDKRTRPLLFAKSLNTTEYLTQAGTREYTNITAFAASGITVTFLDFKHPEYRQAGHTFTPYLSIVDALINLGPSETKKMIQNINLLPPRPMAS